MVSPTNNISFRETPVEDLAEASNTALICGCMHGKIENVL